MMNHIQRLSAKFSLPMDELVTELKKKERLLSKELSTVQKNVLRSNRSILVEWMMEACKDLGYSTVTSHICIGILDRILSKRSVPPDVLQLVGVACILVTAKLEEEAIPQVHLLNELTSFTYTNELILQMEMNVLHCLGWSLTTITSSHFLGLYLDLVVSESEIVPYQRTDYPIYFERAKQLAQQLSDLSCLDLGFLQYYPSLVAAGCVMAARRTTPVSELWPQHLELLTGYPQEEAFFVSSLLLELLAVEEPEEEEEEECMEEEPELVRA